MIRALLLFLMVLLLLRAVWRLLGGIVQGSISAGHPQTGRRPAAPTAVKMAQDPMCGTYVIPHKAVTLARGGETLYFCSDTCRDQYVSSHR